MHVLSCYCNLRRLEFKGKLQGSIIGEKSDK